MSRVPSGILVIDKPAGISSARTVAIVKSALKAKKLGHAGTLDPMATGLLICCINHATKLSGFFLEGRKTYDALITLGVDTDTQDATGVAVKEYSLDLHRLNDTLIQSVFKKFSGELEQQPPVYSALKHKGVPLYKYARRGKPVQKPVKRIYIDSIAIQEIDLPQIRFSVTCSAGTYIRTLCADIGRVLGCGGHLAALRRTHSSEFSIDQAVALEKVSSMAVSGEIAGRIIHLADVLHHLPALTVSETMADRIRNGIILQTTDFDHYPELEPEGHLRIIAADRSLVAVVRRRRQGNRIDYRCIIPAEAL